MSPVNDQRLPERLSTSSLQRRRDRQRSRGNRFLKGPIPLHWLEQAARLPGKALAIGLVIWFLSGLKGRMDKIAVSDKQAIGVGVSRKARYRAIQALEKAGLITVVRRRGVSPRVAILDIEPTQE